MGKTIGGCFFILLSMYCSIRKAARMMQFGKQMLKRCINTVKTANCLC